GRFAFAVWGPPADNPWMSSIRTVLSDHIVLPTPEPGAPGPFRYQNVDALLTLLRDAGFTDLNASSWRAPLLLGGGMDTEAAVDFALSAFSIGQQLDQSDQITANNARSDLAGLFSQYVEEGHVRMQSHVYIVTGMGAAG
ncbi:MAG: class I SAM-dependent methyltransferase, partial [Pseudomonadota bacterium]